MDRFEIRAYPFHGLARIELRIDGYRESVLVGWPEGDRQFWL